MIRRSIFSFLRFRRFLFLGCLLLSISLPSNRSARAAYLPPALANSTEAVTAFYYPWYAAPQTDGFWFHWDANGHQPPDDIASNFYPFLGTYSVNDPGSLETLSLFEQHLQWLERAHIRTVVYSWWGRGRFEDLVLPAFLDAADRHGIKVAFHLEPYNARTAAALVEDVKYLYDNYGSHPAFLTVSRPTRWGNTAAPRGVFYIFNVPQSTNAEWIAALDSLDGTPYDGIFLGETVHTYTLIDFAHLDGIYTYDVHNLDGSTFSWLKDNVTALNSVFSASVGPGFVNTRVNPGSTQDKSRNNGATYDTIWQNAYLTAPEWVSITSFNEWHEGTQIEPALPKSVPGITYYDYEGAYGLTGAAASTAYLDRTAYWIDRFHDRTAPAVTAVTPTQGATGVPSPSPLTATFSEDVDPATLTSDTFTLAKADEPTRLAASVGYDPAACAATLQPLSGLDSTGTLYTATLKGGAGGVKDRVGNPLPSDVTWTFTSADTVAPTMISVFPSEEATGVSSSTTVTATFSEAMDPATVTADSFTLRLDSGASVEASLIYDATTRTATLHPAQPLDPAGATYSVTVKGGTGGVMDTAGNVLAEDKTWTFTTADTFPPTVTGFSPANGASSVPLTSAVTAVFSEAMDPATLADSTVTLTKQGSGAPVPATVTYDASSRTVTLQPSAPLDAAGATYTATIRGGSGGAKDAAGNPLAADQVWTFATADTLGPSIIASAPANGATGVPLAASVTTTFSEPMTAATITASTFTLTKQGSGTPLSATVTYSAATRTATLRPSANLDKAGVVYTASITGGVKDANGNPLAATVTWSFTSADTVAPTVTAFSPASGATGVAATASVTATFSEAMNPATLTAQTVTLVKQGTSTPVAATLSYDSASRTVTLRPASGLDNAGVTYTATVVGGSGGVKDPSGNPLASNKVWTFTTADTLAPTVTSVTPASGATKVAVNSSVTAVFSEAMNAATLTTQAFKLVKQGTTTPVIATVSYASATRTVTLKPTATLDATGATYTATVVGGSSGAKDAAGNALASSVSWSFATADTTAPVLSNVRVTAITQTAATITWTTNEASDTQVLYGKTSSLGTSSSLNAALVTSHSVTLTGLLKKTTYFYKAQNRDSAGNLATSAVLSFKTAN